MGLTIAILISLVLLFFIERAKPDLVSRVEENILATILAIMTLVSFAQVIARYGFNTGWGGALEFTRILFAWLILFGMSYGIKTKSH
ncbi:MAG: TRAP transporter small permease subunit, partial [Rhodospirillaceae bacterium]|nr:TRAP transporter small permease subunit [Rhodospirillaceae bacterium]